ncbi:peroxiredoxin [Ideonella azotifigens]|nr:peroxiredoxin [Ideonella azotifigens]MCD2343556.1 peroxiredoxin [Ideonella azotifigens]
MWVRRACLGMLGCVLVASLAVVGQAKAALAPGDKAPDFNADAALGGQPFKFSLSGALKKGPVVLYFFPKAFTSGCTLEAHLFAEATPKFSALGATVIGMSRDSLETLQRFSVEECRNSFAVAADPESRTIKAYGVGLTLLPDVAGRISFAISPRGQILDTLVSGDPEEHVTAMMKAVQAWRAANPNP